MMLPRSSTQVIHSCTCTVQWKCPEQKQSVQYIKALSWLLWNSSQRLSQESVPLPCLSRSCLATVAAKTLPGLASPATAPRKWITRKCSLILALSTSFPSSQSWNTMDCLLEGMNYINWLIEFSYFYQTRLQEVIHAFSVCPANTFVAIMCLWPRPQSRPIHLTFWLVTPGIVTLIAGQMNKKTCWISVLWLEMVT